MSSSETFNSATDLRTYVPETTAPEPEENVKVPSASDTDNSVAPEDDGMESVNGVDSEVSLPDVHETSEKPTKEINPSIQDAKNVGEVTDEAKEETAGDSGTCNINPDGQSANNVLRIQDATAMGAGDTGVPAKQDECNDLQKQEGETAPACIIEPLASVNDKPSAQDDKKAEADAAISKLKDQAQKAFEERDSYKKKLETAEKKLSALQQSYDSLLKGDSDEVMLRRMIEQLKSKLIQTSLQLEDRIHIVANQERQISALNSQVASLKEVESLTRSLLQIRNMEVKHLQAEVDDMGTRITEERERYNAMINKMDAAVKLNADLKKEYEIQLSLFRDLREKYEEKVTLLSEEKRALEATIDATAT